MICFLIFIFLSFCQFCFVLEEVEGFSSTWYFFKMALGPFWKNSRANALYLSAVMKFYLFKSTFAFFVVPPSSWDKHTLLRVHSWRLQELVLVGIVEQFFLQELTQKGVWAGTCYIWSVYIWQGIWSGRVESSTINWSCLLGSIFSAAVLGCFMFFGCQVIAFFWKVINVFIIVFFLQCILPSSLVKKEEWGIGVVVVVRAGYGMSCHETPEQQAGGYCEWKT